MGHTVHLTLASQSKQREKILQTLGFPFYTWTPSGREYSTASSVAEKAREIARNKAEEALQENRTRLILAADTLIELEGQALGKPENETTARSMLKKLAGTAHTAHTALCLYDQQEQQWIEKAEQSIVYVYSMTGTELQWLLDSQEWKDAAGGYKIQGRAACFIKKIEGSYSNVLGLPIRLLYSILSAYDYIFRKTT